MFRMRFLNKRSSNVMSEDLTNFFDEIPLPFSYIHFPYPEESGFPRHPTHKFYVNNVISELTARMFNKAGIPHTEDKKHWNFSWGQQFDIPEYHECTAWQKINHFAGAYLLGRKDEFHKRIMAMKTRAGDFIDFYPESYLLPDESKLLKDRWPFLKYWIIKPHASSKGEGISVVNSAESQPPNTNVVCQCYIEKPLLIFSRKFDCRLYALVTSIAPLRVYLHEYGLARFASNTYGDNITDLKSHLTNVSINKVDQIYQDSKISLQQLYTELEKVGIDPKKIREQFDKITACCVIAGASIIRPFHQKHVPHRHTSFELFGIDILIDEGGHCWVMEINVSPSMSGRDSELDKEIKSNITAEMYNIVRVIACNPDIESPCKGIELYDENWKKSLSQVDKNKEIPWDWEKPIFADMVMVRDYLEEKKHLQKFHCIFPKRKTVDSFIPCFNKLGYFDRSFIHWIKMTKGQKLEALERGKQMYVSILENINSKL